MRIIYLLCVCVVLSACSVTGKKDKPELISAKNTPTQLSTADSTAKSDRQNTPRAQEDDLLQRIKNGFAFDPAQELTLNAEHVRFYENWNATHPTFLNNLFLHARPFLFYIVEEIDRRGLPMELALLPAVESAYRARAVSKSKAAGLWQFIPSTGRFFKLEQSWWYDARLDVVLATNAAFDYLEELNKQFEGDWFLALAAYNGGRGTLTKAINRNKRKGLPANYAALRLRSETARYVPKMIALKNIINDPQRFNVVLPTITNTQYFSVIPIERQLDLNKFASELGVDFNEFRTLNAGFKRWASPPQGSYRIIVPSAKAEKAYSLIANQPSNRVITNSRHTVVKGESLYSISKKYGTTVNAIKHSNRLKGAYLSIGQQLLIPVGDANTTSQAPSSRQLTANEPNSTQHRVAQGETLWSIAQRYQVSINNLRSWNNLLPTDALQINQLLTILR